MQWTTWVDVKMESANFKTSDPISVLSFAHNFKTVCDGSGILEGAAMVLFPHFMKDPSKAALVHRICATKEDDPQ